MSNILEILQSVPSKNDNRIYGVIIGIVTNNNDTEGMGRVKVKFPSISNSDESHWARIATFMAGPGRGAYFLPEIDDEVLVAFENGSFDSPFIVGCLWNGQDSPPQTNSDGNNHIRELRTRSGHSLLFDDSSDASTAKVTLTTANGHCIELDDASNTGKIALTTNGGHSLILDDQNQAVTLDDSNNNNITLDAQGVSITDVSGNTISTTKTSVVIEGAGGAKLEFLGKTLIINDGSLQVM